MTLFTCEVAEIVLQSESTSDGGEGSKNMRQLGKNSGMYRESYYSRLNHLLCILHPISVKKTKD